MDMLRTILLVLGILLVAGIYFADRLKRRKSRQERHWSEIDFESTPDDSGSFTADKEPLTEEWVGKAVTLSARRNVPLADEHLEGLQGLGRESIAIDEMTKTSHVPSAMVQPDETEEDVIVLTVMAGEGKRFSGPLLLKVLQEVGLEHGLGGIFHYCLAGKEEPLFSAANILEPGRFDLSEIVTLQTPGIALFMRLPAVVAGELALQTLLQKSRQMAAQLSGTLCDEQRHTLGEQKIEQLAQTAKRYTAQ